MNTSTSRVSAAEALDPRVRRSRHMLHNALATLLTTKDFDKISIADIAEASTLNRATFYDHYADKFALLQCMVGNRFAELMAKRGVGIDDCESALRSIALGVCDYLAEAPTSGGSSHQGCVQTAIVDVIREMFLTGLHDSELVGDLDKDVVASTVAWAVYGAANAWMLKPVRCSAEHMADKINQLIKPIIIAAVTSGEPAHTLPGRRQAHRG